MQISRRSGKEKTVYEPIVKVSYGQAYSGTQSRRNFGRLKATLGDFSYFLSKITGDFGRFKAILGDFGRF